MEISCHQNTYDNQTLSPITHHSAFHPEIMLRHDSSRVSDNDVIGIRWHHVDAGQRKFPRFEVNDGSTLGLSWTNCGQIEVSLYENAGFFRD